MTRAVERSLDCQRESEFQRVTNFGEPFSLLAGQLMLDLAWPSGAGGR
jgi:hypothetical protein